MSNIKIEPLLQVVVERRASDLHLQVGLPPIIRQQGNLIPIPTTPVLTEEDMETLAFSVLDEEQRLTLQKSKEIDSGFMFGDKARFRVNIFHEKGYLAMSLRFIPGTILTVEQLRLPSQIEAFASYTQGLVLFVGPTGSGKSTSMAAILDKINQTRKERIVTIEDPIEFIYRPKQSVVVQREVHHDTLSFAVALRSALRQDPDIIEVGELRDLETISLAMTAAETGHLVFATMHTNSAAETVNRIIDVFPENQQPQIRSNLSSVLRAVCSQRFVATLDGNRMVAAEVMIGTSAIRNMIREGQIHQIPSSIQTGHNEGMISLDESLLSLVRQHLVSPEEAMKASRNPKDFKLLLDRKGGL